MKSRIDTLLTGDERRVLMLYADPAQSGLGRAIRLSFQYAVGTGIFVVLALAYGNAIYVLPVYGIFVAFMIVRLMAAKKLAGIMPSVISKYESRIAELEGNPESGA